VFETTEAADTPSGCLVRVKTDQCDAKGRVKQNIDVSTHPLDKVKVADLQAEQKAKEAAVQKDEALKSAEADANQKELEAQNAEKAATALRKDAKASREKAERLKAAAEPKPKK